MSQAVAPTPAHRACPRPAAQHGDLFGVSAAACCRRPSIVAAADPGGCRPDRIAASSCGLPTGRWLELGRASEVRSASPICPWSRPLRRGVERIRQLDLPVGIAGSRRISVAGLQIRAPVLARLFQLGLPVMVVPSQYAETPSSAMASADCGARSTALRRPGWRAGRHFASLSFASSIITSPTVRRRGIG